MGLQSCPFRNPRLINEFLLDTGNGFEALPIVIEQDLFFALRENEEGLVDAV